MPIATLTLAGFMATPAQAVLTIRLTDSLGTQTFVGTADNCGPNCTSLVAARSNAAFVIDIQVGTSNAPGGPAEITLGGTVQSLVAGNNSLTVEVSDTGFLLPAGPAALIQTVNTNTPAITAAAGSLTATGYYDGGNVLFCQNAPGNVCDAATGAANFGSFLVSNPGQTSSVGVNFAIPFSLDQVLTYSFTGAGTALVTSTLSAVVPEPASVALLGSVLLLTGSLIRRRNRTV
jgi:hypothetical protein